MLRWITVIVLTGVLLAETSSYKSEVAAKTFLMIAKERPSKCDVQELLNDQKVKNVICNVENQHVPHGSLCNVTRDIGDYTHVETVECEYGNFKTTEARVHRQKKFCGILIGIIQTGLAVCALFCFRNAGGSGSGGGGCTTTPSPPKFPSDCRPADLQEVNLVPAGRTNVQVNWTEPIATDTDSTIVVIKQVSTPQNGEYFEGSVYDNGYKHTVVYEATDPDGLRAMCTFSFSVKILVCSAPPYLSNGRRTCSHDGTFIRGSTCVHECNLGYERIGSETTTCQGETSPIWSETTECRPTTCSQPADFENGRVSCQDDRYFYQSVCTVHCNTGYRLIGDTFIRCSADGNWTHQVDTVCEDDTPPYLSCLTPQLYYADAKKHSTAVTWAVPIATDNVDANIDIIKIDGPELGAILSGTSYVTYTAVDEGGNRAQPCTIELRVQQIKCPHPLAIFSSQYIQFSCDDYAYGTECEVSCMLNFPLNGSDVVTCKTNLSSAAYPEGYWSWGMGTKPFCKMISCPTLDPPINGAMIYDTVNLRPIYTMLCKENYTITSDLVENGVTINFNGLFTCLDSGTWIPIAYAPGCTVPRKPGRIGLLSEMLYYSEDCTNQTTQEQIVEIFQDILANVMEFYQTLCPSGESCAASDPTIICGLLNKRKRKSIYSYEDSHILSKRQTTAYYIRVKFVIEVAWNPPVNVSIDDAFVYYDGIQADLKAGTAAKVADGWFVMDNAPISMTQADDPFTTESNGNLMCDDGYRLSGVLCKACPAGHYLEADACSRCPLGSYSDAEGMTTCTPCDQGFSTKGVGANSSSQCIPLCQPGTFSPDGLEVCSACRMSTYQTNSGQTICYQCPANTYTKTDGSTSVDQCLDYDVFLGSSEERFTLYEPADITSDFSLALWIKPRISLPIVSLQLLSNDSSVVTLTISDDTVLNIRGTATSANTTLDSNTWNHVVVLFDFTSNTISTEINGNRVVSQSNALSSDIMTSLDGVQGKLTLSNTGSLGIYISGLHIEANILTPDEIQTRMTSCHMTSEYEIVGMDVFTTQSVPGVKILAPSVCDATNECASGPCGSHICVNEIGGYSCVCYDGFTGRSCETPPNYCRSNKCQNGATCLSGDDGFNCTCMTGYTGEFCEFGPVNGEWSVWSAWTACNQTCAGIMTRSRSCNNPAPGSGGADCTGKQTETEPCNEACPSCPQLNRLSGTMEQCAVDIETGNQVCTLLCLDGFQFPPGLNGSQEIYTCGPGTGYRWAPKETTLACVTGYRPTGYSLSTAIQYNEGIPLSANPEVTSTVEARLSDTPCFNMAACLVTVATSDSKQGSIGPTLTITFTIPLQESGELDLVSFSENGTVSACLQEVVDAINHLEETAKYVQNNVNTLFTVTASDVLYSVDSTSLHVQPTIDCSSGQTSDNGLCVACPEGTYLDEGCCQLCKKGSYQSSPGQTICILCPCGYTTPSIGSAFFTQCSEIAENTEDTCNTGTTHAPEDEETKRVAIGVGITAALLSIALLIGLACYKKKVRGHVYISSTSIVRELSLNTNCKAPAKLPLLLPPIFTSHHLTPVGPQVS